MAIKSQCTLLVGVYPKLDIRIAGNLDHLGDLALGPRLISDLIEIPSQRTV